MTNTPLPLHICIRLLLESHLKRLTFQFSCIHTKLFTNKLFFYFKFFSLSSLDMSPTDKTTSTLLSLSSSSSDTNLNAMLSIPMPTPGVPGAPKFKGKHVSDFLDSLEQHADSTRVSHSLLPGYVLRYCHNKVRIVIGSWPLLTGDDWVETRVHLTDLYRSNDSIPLNSPDRLCQWCSNHGESGIIMS